MTIVSADDGAGAALSRTVDLILVRKIVRLVLVPMIAARGYVLLPHRRRILRLLVLVRNQALRCVRPRWG